MAEGAFCFMLQDNSMIKFDLEIQSADSVIVVRYPLLSTDTKLSPKTAPTTENGRKIKFGVFSAV